MNFRTAINLRMHAGTCPGAGALGECPGIWLKGSHGNLGHFSAAVYLWSGAESLLFATVASWFEDLGATNVLVYATMHDAYNVTVEGRCSDGARPLLVTFDLDRATAQLRGLADESTEEPASAGVDRDASTSDMFEGTPT